MSESGSGQIVSSYLLKLMLGVVSLIALAMLACTGSDEGSAYSPTPPTGMFSTLPTTEPPIEGDRPPTVELNTPQPTLTPNPTYTPVPTPTPNPTGTPEPTPTPNPTGTPVPTPTPNPTGTPVPMPTPNPTGTPVPMPTPNPTGTPVPMPTPYPKATPDPCYKYLLWSSSNAVIRAVWEGPKAVRCVLKQGADVNAKDSRGYSALWWAILEENPEIVEILLDAGAKTGTSQ